MPPWTSPLQSWGSRLPEINYLIAFAYQTDSHREQAREYYQRQLGLVPGHLASLLGAGTVALDESRFKDSEGFLQSVLARAPDHVQANYEWGSCASKRISMTKPSKCSTGCFA